MIQKTIGFFTRGHQRTLLAKKNIIYSFLIKAMTMVITFTIISLSIKYLGKDAYGIWVILAGLAVWTDFFDFGFTHGLRNMLAEAIAKGELDKGKHYVSTSFLVMLLISIGVIVIFIPLIEFLDWNTLLKIDFLTSQEIKTLLYVVLSSFILKMIYKPITAVLNAYQWPSIVQLISLIGSIASLIVLYYLYRTQSSDTPLTAYVITQSFAPVIVLILASVYLFTTKFKSIKPSISYVDLSYFKKLFTLGGGFFLLQLSALIIYQTDNMIISNLFGPVKVAEYNIVQRYFSILSIGIGTIMAPFWSAFTDAYVKNEMGWIESSVKKLIKLLAIFSIVAVLFVLISNTVYQLWIDSSIYISFSVSAMMAISVIVTGFSSIFIYVINGIGKIRLSIYTNLFAAIINIPLCYFFADTLMLGTAGILLASIVCVSFISVIAFTQYRKIITASASGIWNK